MSGAAWRAMAPEDIPAAAALADRVHPAFFEDPAVFADRLALFPAGSLVLVAGGALGGYALAYPCASFRPPPLDTVLGRLAPDADVLYIHDVALAPERRGAGLAVPGIERLLALAAPFGRAELVSVYGTAPFWGRFGFRDETARVPPGRLAPYGADARYMARTAPP